MTTRDLLAGLPLPPPSEAHLYDPSVTPITRFKGPHRPLSNYMPASFYADGRLWKSSEHRFNALKSLNPTEQAWVADAPTPAEAKRRGNDRTGRITLRPDWDTIARYEVMTETLHYKFTAHPARMEFLLSTGQALLVEITTWHDRVWGTCVCGRAACSEPGHNHLGRSLMRLRYQYA